MARVYRQRYTVKQPDGSTVVRTARKWYIDHTDRDGKRRRVPGYTDKAATLQKAAELDRRAQRGESGMTDRYEEHRKRPLSEHVADWRQSLADKGVTAGYVALSVKRVKTICNACRFERWPDIDANKVSRYLAARRADGLSIKTSNHYLQKIKQFCRWAQRTGRVSDNPLDCLTLQNSRTDRRHDRRALEPHELRRLIAVTEAGPIRYGVPGHDRAILYRTAVETGLRVNELKTLKVASVDVDATPPTITVRAAYSKHRREDVQPIPRPLADDLWRYLSGKLPGAPAFRMPYSTSVPKMLRADLSDARIDYRDDAGRVLDFHALRHSFISNLARGGVHPKVAQQLARHSTITLTMDRYSHTVVGDLSAALEKLPDTRTDPAEAESATGTCDAADPSGKKLCHLLSLLPAAGGRGVSSAAAKQNKTDREVSNTKHCKTRGQVAASRRISSSVETAAGRTRTDALRFTKPLLYQLSYGGAWGRHPFVLCVRDPRHSRVPRPIEGQRVGKAAASSGAAAGVGSAGRRTQRV